MKLIARCLFVLAALTVVTPVIVGLIGYHTALPIGLIVAALMTGIIIQDQSDPVYAG